MTDHIKMILSSCNLEEAIDKADDMAFNNYIKSVESLYLEKYRSGAYEELAEIIKYQSRKAARCGAQQKRENPISYEMGRYIGVLNLYQEVIREAYTQKNVEEAMLVNMDSIPHLIDILGRINQKPGIQHARLAEVVGIDRSTLTGLMNRINETGLITYTRSGKFKYYELTVAGQKYFSENGTVTKIVKKQQKENELYIQLRTQSKLKVEVNNQFERMIQQPNQIGTLCELLKDQWRRKKLDNTEDKPLSTSRKETSKKRWVNKSILTQLNLANV